MTNGVGWACRFKTGVAIVVEAAMKEVEEMEIVVSTVQKVAEEAWEILNHQSDREEVN